LINTAVVPQELFSGGREPSKRLISLSYWVLTGAGATILFAGYQG
jgi:hypothetical protein